VSEHARRWLAAAAFALLGASIAHAESGTWIAWGGETTFHLDPDALARAGLRVESVRSAQREIDGARGRRYETLAFGALDASPLEIRHEGRAIRSIGGGALRHAGGFVLAGGGVAIDLRSFALRARAGARSAIDVVGADGTVWFTADHAHYGFDDASERVFSMREMNLRVADALAARIGRADLAGLPIGGLEFHSHVFADRRAGTIEDVCSAPWPAPPATHADLELVAGDFSGFADDVYVKRCAGCTATSTNGTLVVNPDASLRNAGTTAIAWYGKFGGAHPPYGYDQHPFLVWNLYRLDADGGVRQIGVSGVKHAFYTVNHACACGGGHVLYPTCEDVYSSFNNDASTALGPRSEIVPHAALWGRCGSVYDADCDGEEDADGGARDLFEFRMNVAESDLLPPLADDARYFIEYAYVVRDDDTLENSIGHREVAFAKSGADWAVRLAGDAPDFALGPVVDRWIAPGIAADRANVELASELGRARVAVQATPLADGRWRYRYAVMNLDYAHAEIDPAHAAPPDLRVVAAHGFDRFRVPLAAGVDIAALAFADADGDAANDWNVRVADGALVWTAPPAANTLDWGTLYAFTFVASAAPARGDVGLDAVATASEPALRYAVGALVPGTEARASHRDQGSR